MLRNRLTLFIFFSCTLLCVSLLNAQSFDLNSTKQLANNSIDEVVIEEDANTINKWDYFMYPVPASTELNLKITRGHVNINQVIVTNTEGDEVVSLTNQSSVKLKVNLNDLKPGKYFIRVVTDTYSTPKIKRFYVSK